MKPGDMVEANTGHAGVIIGVEYMYPGQPKHSPLRSVEVLWNNGQPHHSFNRHINEVISSISPFAIKRVISRA